MFGVTALDPRQIHMDCGNGNHTYLTSKPHVWRQMFQDCLAGLKLEDWGFRPYSLRRGGATSYFVKVGSLDRVLILGRWIAIK